MTALLQSRTVDFPTGNEENKPEVIPSRAMVSEGKKELLTAPVTNGFESGYYSTPIVGSSVGETLMLHLYFYSAHLQVFLLVCCDSLVS